MDSITITIDTLTTGALKIGTFGVAGGTATFVSDQATAITAISALDVAINSVNTMRANIGAFVNRLEHAINNLDISNTNQQAANMAAAESVIRDVDFATETSNYTKNQILTQSSTAMLAQANALPSSVLTLFK